MSRQKDDVALAWEFSFKESDIKLFLKLESSINEIGRTLRESGKIPDSKREDLTASMTEGYLSIMSVLYDILTSSLDVKNHSVRRVVSASRSTEEKIVDVFVAAGAAAKTQPWRAWEVMSTYNELVLHHSRMMKRLNGAVISVLRKAVHALEEHRKSVPNLGDYLVEIAVPALQVEENVHILIDDSDTLQLREYQISQLHNLLGRVKTLLEWKRPQD
ncbi:hypothetical protein [Candidatus Minimicrobia sp. QA0096]|uniref:hypothetical protein n=1 Tax=Candidatus Minimicrobia sp. QA0096 TaxID=3118470 RepID=UPI0030D14006